MVAPSKNSDVNPLLLSVTENWELLLHTPRVTDLDLSVSSCQEAKQRSRYWKSQATGSHLTPRAKLATHARAALLSALRAMRTMAPRPSTERVVDK